MWDWCGGVVRWAGVLTLLVALSASVAPAADAKPAGAAPFAPLRDFSADNLPLGFRKDKSAAQAAERSAVEAATLSSRQAQERKKNEEQGALSSTRESADAETLKKRSTGGSVGMVLFVVVVLGVLLFLGLHILKKVLPNGKALFSTPALEILGRTHFDSQRYLSLVRVGRRLLVVGISPSGFSPISEITDEVEAAELMAVAKPKTSAGKSIFQRMFQSQLAGAEQQELVSSITGNPGAAGSAGLSGGNGVEAVAGEFGRSDAIESLDQRRARMQAQVRNLREKE